MKNFFETRLFFFLLGMLIFTGISSFAYSYMADDVEFNPTDDNWDVDDSKSALDYLKSNISKCDFSCGYTEGQVVFEQAYTGQDVTFPVRCLGKYQLEVWGAQGGSYNDSYRGGYGAYAVGNVNLGINEKLYIAVGEGGTSFNSEHRAATYNGGGDGNAKTETNRFRLGSTGGGATHIALVSKSGETDKTGELYFLDDYKGTLVDSKYYSSDVILIVAAGGGGAMYNSYTDNGRYDRCNGGNGGGISGAKPTSFSTSAGSYQLPTGGSQTSGGTTGSSWYSSPSLPLSDAAHFGRGRVYNTTSTSFAGGGGGFYGGGTGDFICGAGGSSYIAGSRLDQNVAGVIVNKMYCYECTESSDYKTYTISTYGTTSHSAERNPDCVNGYSSDPISGCAKAGNGYVRITYLGRFR